MSQHVEPRLISKIIASGDFKSVLKAGITADMFSTTECRIMFEDLWTYYHAPSTSGMIPTKRIMRKNFPAFKEFKHGKENVIQLCEELREAAIARRILDLVSDVPENIRKPYKVLDRLRTGVLSIQGMTPSSRDIQLVDYADEVVREYNAAKYNEAIPGIHWPWRQLTEHVGGIQNEDFILFYGRNKSMKTFIGCYCAADFFWHNKRVMFYTAEMSPAKIMKRIVAAYCQIDYKALKEGTLSQEQERSFFEAMQVLKEVDSKAKNTGALLVTCDKDGGTHGGGGVSHIQAKAEEFEPDIIFVDSFYRLRDDRTGKMDYDWKIQANIVQDLKHMNQRLQVPVIGIGQANKKSREVEDLEGLDDGSFTDTIGQEVDLGIRIIKKSVAPEGANLRFIFAAAREAEATGFNVLFRPYTTMRWDGFFSFQEQDPTENKPKTTKVKKNQLKSEKERKASREAINKQYQARKEAIEEEEEPAEAGQ